MNSSHPPRDVPQPTGIYLDYGPALPERYGRPAMRLLWQAPRKRYACWETAELPLEPPLLVLRDLTRGKAEVIRIGSDAAEFWFDAEPDRRYQAELQLGERVVLVSNGVLTPRDAPSDVVDPEWPLDEAAWAAIFKASGMSNVGRGGFYPGTR